METLKRVLYLASALALFLGILSHCDVAPFGNMVGMMMEDQEMYINWGPIGFSSLVIIADCLFSLFVLWPIYNKLFSVEISAPRIEAFIYLLKVICFGIPAIILTFFVGSMLLITFFTFPGAYLILGFAWVLIGWPLSSVIPDYMKARAAAKAESDLVAQNEDYRRQFFGFSKEDRRNAVKRDSFLKSLNYYIDRLGFLGAIRFYRRVGITDKPMMKAPNAQRGEVQWGLLVSIVACFAVMLGGLSLWVKHEIQLEKYRPGCIDWYLSKENNDSESDGTPMPQSVKTHCYVGDGVGYRDERFETDETNQSYWRHPSRYIEYYIYKLPDGSYSGEPTNWPHGWLDWPAEK